MVYKMDGENRKINRVSDDYKVITKWMFDFKWITQKREVKIRMLRGMYNHISNKI